MSSPHTPPPGLDATAAGDERALQAPWRLLTETWLAQAGTAIALAIDSAACLLDLEAVVVAGSCCELRAGPGFVLEGGG